MPTKILVVDDEPAVCELLQAVLSAAGMEAQALTSSAQAAARLKQEKFDAVFLDVHMPPPDGMELARQMRAAGFNQRTPIVMITGDDDPAVLARGFEAGASFFLFKPIDRERVLRVIRVTRGSIQREKRRYQRVAVRCKVSLESNHRKLDGTTLDLSLGGFQVEAPGVFAAGARVKVSLQLAPGVPPLRATGRVARVVEDNRMGIQFDNLTAADSERLQEFLLPLILAPSEQEQTRRVGG